MRHPAALLLAILLSACGKTHSDRTQQREPSVARTGRDTVWRVSFDALGPIRTGSPLAAFRAAVGAPPRSGSAPGSEGCEYVGIPESALTGDVRFMVVNDTVVRVDVDSASVTTIWGDRVGDAEAAVLARHRGGIRVEPHKYTGPEGHYLIVDPSADTLHRLIFETDGRRVTRYRAGLRPYVDWVEGCA